MRGRVTFVGMLLLCAGAVRAGEAIAWRTDVKPALSEAKRVVRPAFVDFWAVWCVPCKQMDATTYRDPAVAAAMAAFVPLKVDFDVQEVFSDRYGVSDLPLVLFLDGAGREIARHAGLIETARLVKLMRHVSEGYAGYLEALANPKDASSQVALADYLLGAGNADEAEKLLRRATRSLGAAAPDDRERVELLLARAQVASGEAKTGTATLERLADAAGSPEVRGGALEVLVQLWRDRGDAARAAAALQRLRAEFPDRARALEG